MTFPSSGALSAANINSQFGWPSGRAVSLADPAIVGTGGVVTPGTTFSYSNLYNNSPKWLFAYGSAINTITIFPAFMPSSFGNGTTFLIMYYNSSDSYTYLVRSYLNGNIHSTYRTNFAVSAWNITTDSSNNIYINWGNTLVKYNSSFTQVASSQQSYSGSYGFDSDVWGAQTQAGYVANSIYGVGVFNGIPLLNRWNSSCVGQWTLRTTNAGANVGTAYMVAPRMDNSENCYVTLQGNTSSYTLWGVAKINSSGSVVFNVGFNNYANNAYTANFAVATPNLAGTAIALAGQDFDNYAPRTGINVALMNSSGVLQWAKVLYHANNGGFQSGKFFTVIDDYTGDVYAVSSISYDGVNNSCVYIIKYNSSGTLQWQRKMYCTNVANTAVMAYGATFANGVFRITLAAGQGDGYGGLFDQVAYTFQVPLDGSGTGTYTPLGGISLIYAAGVLTETTRSFTSISAIASFSSVTSSYATVSAPLSSSSSTGTLNKI